MALSPQGHAPAAHHRLLIRELEGLAAGRWDRLMLLLPPGSAKSTYASLIFPPWFLANRPWAHVIAASHTASLARSFGRGVRALIQEHESRLDLYLDPANRSAGRFGVIGGGSYFATGVRGPITGRRADLLLIDDPVKSQAEADSGAARDHLWDWFRSDLVTRLKPGGRVVLVMTRWHPDDLGGRLLQSADAWRVVRLPALAEADDALGRPVGAPLWPEWEDEAALRRKRAVLGDRTFEALFQQSPRSSGGRLFKIAQLPIVMEEAAGTQVRAWDLAATQDGDFTAGILLTRTSEGGFQVNDVRRFQGGPEMVVQIIRETAERDGVSVTVGLPQDPGQAGRAQIAYLTKALAGFRVVSSRESGSKETRAMPVASQVNAGTVSLLRGSWNRDFLEELQDFPGGAKDDQVDALSRAFSMVLEPASPAKLRKIAWGTR
ncbi:MAG: phage terminase large subunit [Acetobacteraceae bacterium]|nr:phage terminase large subunit [Acetobacteraceae bacterium]